MSFIRNFIQKWGPKNPIMLHDPEFGPVRFRAGQPFRRSRAAIAGPIKDPSGDGSRPAGRKPPPLIPP